MLGHNAPPPFEALSLEIETAFALISDSTVGGEITNDAQEQALDGLLDQLRALRKKADAERVAEKKPHDDAGKAVQAKYKPLLDRCDAADADIKRLLTPYRTAKQKAKDDAARKLREEAEAAQLTAQEALSASDSLEERFEAEAVLEHAAKLAVVANKADRAPTGLRTYYEAEIVDARAALNHLVKTNRDDFMALIQRLADYEARTTRRPIAGVVYNERKKAA